MAHGREIALQARQHVAFGTALKDLGEKAAAGAQNLAGEIRREFDQADDLQMIGLAMAGRIGGHVRQDDIGLAAQPVAKLLRRRRIEKIHDFGFDARQSRDLQKIDADHSATAVLAADLLRRDLRPAAGRGTQIDDILARLENMIALVDLDQLESRALAIAFELGAHDIGIVQLALQPERR